MPLGSINRVVVLAPNSRYPARYYNGKLCLFSLKDLEQVLIARQQHVTGKTRKELEGGDRGMHAVTVGEAHGHPKHSHLLLVDQNWLTLH